eukprot:11793455-Prorocentrum_lima.AAC.1
MTSSLVGSEMCIRDSNKSTQVSSGAWLPPELLGDVFVQEIIDFDEFRPVSYTHLTLPTICSV